MAVRKVLELREVENRTSLAVQGLDVVGSSTVSVKVSSALNVGNINLVDKILELVKVHEHKSSWHAWQFWSIKFKIGSEAGAWSTGR